MINKIDIPPEKEYLPPLLITRIKLRKAIIWFAIFALIFDLVFLFLGVIYFSCAKKIIDFIPNIDDYWNQIRKSTIKDKEITHGANFIGIFLIMNSLFNMMNVIVIFIHIYLGGLRMRLRCFNYINLISNNIVMIISLAVIAMYGGILPINPAFFVFALLNFVHNLTLFTILRRLIIKESKYILPMNMLELHRKEYLDEFNKKVITEPAQQDQHQQDIQHEINQPIEVNEEQ
jgi:hypothetical protein